MNTAMEFLEIDVQVRIVYALVMLHNVMLDNQPYDTLANLNEIDNSITNIANDIVEQNVQT